MLRPSTPLISRVSGSVDGIIHIGAGSDASLQDYAPLQPRKITLVEADPEACAILAERFQGDSRVHLVEALVGPEAAVAAFHRFSLPRFNGPFGLGRLKNMYPRIAEMEGLGLRSRPLPDILSGMGAHFQGPQLLILDIPGQEASVLSSLPPHFLDKFEWVLVNGTAQAWQEGSQVVQTTLDFLQRFFFEVVETSSEDSDWPSILLRQDQVKCGLQKELDSRAQALVAKSTEIHQQSERIQELDSRLTTLAAERDELATRHQSLATEREELSTRLSTLSSEHSTLVAERDSLVTVRDALQAERSTFDARLSTLSSEHSTLVSEREALSTSLAESKAELEKRAALLVEKATEIHRHSEQNKDLESQNASLRTERDALQAERSTLDARLSTLSSEHSTIVSEREALSTLLDVLTKGRVAQDEQMEKILEANDSLTKERDTLLGKIQNLEAQLAKALDHAKLIDEEFGKAEGQLELIKDLFLREALR